MKLKSVNIKNYKLFHGQSNPITIDDNVTAFIGENESGKSSILECLAKCLNEDIIENHTKYNKMDDCSKFLKKRELNDNSIFAQLNFHIQEKNAKKYRDQLPSLNKFINFNNNLTIDVPINHRLEISDGISFDDDKYYDFALNYIDIHDIEFILSSYVDKNYLVRLDEIIKSIEEKDKLNFKQSLFDIKKSVSKYQTLGNTTVNSYIEWYFGDLMIDDLPLFTYYSDYYSLANENIIDNVINEKFENLNTHEKTLKALIEISEISSFFESNKNHPSLLNEHLDESSIELTEKLSQYWDADKKFEVILSIDKKKYLNKDVYELNIYIKNTKDNKRINLKHRSRGFKWYFNFYIWFEYLNSMHNKKLIFLLDEPGINLHGIAQDNLLNFIYEISNKNQVLYSTHSPFMLKNEHLSNIRSVFNDEKKGAIVTESIHVKNKKALLPLQAALGYKVSQSLFISDKVLLVEGISDVAFIRKASMILKEKNREFLNDDIAITPTGGISKLCTFTSLMNGNDISFYCLLDTCTDSDKKKIDSHVQGKIINKKAISYYHEYTKKEHSDIEDLFEIEEYLEFYNKSNPDKKYVSKTDILESEKGILLSIENFTNEKFSHNPPSLYFQNGYEGEISSETIDRFEKIFKSVNKYLIK